MTSLSSLSRVSISNVRNVYAAELLDLSQFNVICGANGAGKTSILEAISYLGLGRSFRTRKPKSVINTNADSLTVFADGLDRKGFNHKLGVRRSVDHLNIKLDGVLLRNASSLAATLPLLVFNAQVFELIEGGPAHRREFLDWVLFHVEHELFYDSWREYYRALKQRNELLKHGNISEDALAPWDDALVKYGVVLSELRAKQMQYFSVVLRDSGLVFGLGDLKAVLHNGWRDGVSFSDALVASRAKDLRYRTTTIGPHRMEIQFTVGDKPAKDMLSRGQIKMLASQIKLAGARSVVHGGGQHTNVLVLVDDLSAETDLDHRQKLLEDIGSLGCQCFVTGVFVDEVTKMIPDGMKSTVFHVEHGCVTKSSDYDRTRKQL